jgi:hypothetical protein
MSLTRAVGTWVCAFNPVYGQGMTTAAMGAVKLDECLRDQRRRAGNDLAGLAKGFQRKLAQVVAGPWLLATGDGAISTRRHGTSIGKNDSGKVRWRQNERSFEVYGRR